jgi:hypothetical protein
MSSAERAAAARVEVRRRVPADPPAPMPKTVEAVVEEGRRIRLLEAVPLRPKQRVLVTVPDAPADAPPADAPRTPEAQAPARLSEQALAADWMRSEEDEAWTHLQPDPSS